MKGYRVILEPRAAFGSPLKGDTLFGQLCWALLNRYGQGRLQALLHDYAARPFAVCSDGFPSGYLPRPSLPVSYFRVTLGTDRKVVKKKRWVPLDDREKALSSWLDNAKSDSDAFGEDTQREQPHNTINRLTGTTGQGMFAPYSQSQTWYKAGTKLDVYFLLDETRLPLSEVQTLLDDIGAFGYGRDATVGLGKFECIDYSDMDLSAPGKPNACLTLAPCAPQGLGLDSKHSYYNVFTRFGRHGDTVVHKKHGPFKAPLLLADTAAVFSPLPAGQRYIGQGLGGMSETILSRTIPETVHQGYAPYLPVHLVDKEEAT